MEWMKYAASAVMLLCGAATAQQITIHAGTVIDGKGQVLHDTTVVIEGSKIVKIV